MKNNRITGISGISGSRLAWLVSSFSKIEKKILIITSTAGRAKQLADDISFFAKQEVSLILDEDQIFFSFDARNHDQLMDRLNGLETLSEKSNGIVISTVSAALRNLVPHKLFNKYNMTLSYGGDIDFEVLKGNLASLGYERVSMVESRGEFSMRGGILDIFTPGAELPYRIEFFDTEVDSIRTFDKDTQRSLDRLNEVKIGPAHQLVIDRDAFDRAEKTVQNLYDRQLSRLEKSDENREEAIESLKKRRDRLIECIHERTNIQLLENYTHYFYKDTEKLWEYMDDGCLIIDDPDRSCEFLDVKSSEQLDSLEFMLERGQVVPEDRLVINLKADFVKAYNKRPLYIVTPFPKVVRGVSAYDEARDYASKRVSEFKGNLNLLEDELRNYIRQNYRITFVLSSKERVENIDDFLVGKNLRDKVEIQQGVISEGVDFPYEKVCYICDNDIFGGQRSRTKKAPKKSSDKKEFFSDLEKGDYVVHENHGIGRFEGIEQLDLNGDKKDYLKLSYSGSDVLYVPVEQFDIVQKYIGSENKSPRLNKLSGTEWKATKARARAAIQDMTEELIKLYAERQIEKGYAFSEDTDLQREFENRFPHVPTDDQLRSIKEIKQDMEKPESMDRLLCGDVGFGKTEVAARAIFKCVSEGKQGAIMVPTTLLANQHYYTFKERFSDFPVNIEMISRFRTKSQQNQIKSDLKAGRIDIIIGTHSLLAKDVEFNDLGILVIDEEQRFGVAHKEKIKEMKKNVDVLTLSATPIPRTLNMSMTGIKNMSVIEEPPEERFPVQTYVMEEDDNVIREAIIREMDRGGQVFVIFNRVKGIQQVAERIKGLVPSARVAVGHGRMGETILENVMMSFINHENDVLVSTTIIESGIDVPNANTLIVMDSERYGLSQLYQIRGRVGRSNKLAYAYLMYKKDKVLTEVAEKRLRAIREFTEFGSGFKIAMRDLQIRGAGNLLGSEQSGHMMNIGYELYCKLVNDAVRKIRGEEVPELPEETSVEIAISANIPSWYIENETVKIGIYKKIAEIETEEQEEGMYDELVDRFGDIPSETMNLVKISRIRTLAQKLSIERIHEKAGKIIFEFNEKNPLKVTGILKVNDEFDGRAFFHGGIKPFIRIPGTVKYKLDDSIKLLELLKGECIDAVQQDSDNR